MRTLWRRFRLRTKVLLIVGALVVLGAVMPGEDEDPGPAADGRDTSKSSEPAATRDDPDQEDEAEASEEPTEEVPEEIAVPGLRKQSVEQARAALRSAGLKSEVVRQPSWQPAGQVLEQGTKAGVALAAGTVVTLVVAAPMPTVPGVVGQGAAVGQEALRRAGFKVRLVHEVVSSGTDNVVLSQTPSGSESAAPGTVVQLVVSNLVQPLAPVVKSCAPGYQPCLAPASDYDCAGGSGDGPAYASGPIYVSGSDPYDLDSEGDGIACE